MSRIALIADPHVWNFKRHGGPLVRGINRRGVLCLDVLRRAVDVANAHSAPLVVAGDLVDSAGPVQPQLAAALRDELTRCREGVDLILGNHDMTADGDHSLGVYEVGDDHVQAWADTVYLGPVPNGCYAVPFHQDIRAHFIRDVPLIVGHFGVYDDSFPHWAKKLKGAWHVDALFAFMKERNIRCGLFGDWHQRRGWHSQLGSLTADKMRGPCEWTFPYEGQIILQGGALVPTGHDNSGLHGYGTVALWDTETFSLSWQELSGPRFCTVRSDAEEAVVIAEAKRLGHTLFLRRFYDGERPEKPESVEAYEALPLKIEQLALANAQHAVANRASNPSLAEALEQWLSLWLDSCGDTRDIMEEHARRYL